MDVSFLQPVYGYAGPFVSLYLNVSRDAADANRAISVRWSKAREELAALGSPEENLQALDDVVGRSEGHPGPCGQVAFAADGAVVFDVLVDQPPQDHAVHFGPLPRPLPFLARRGEHVPYVLVVMDSTGAEITASDIVGRRRSSRVEPGEWVHKPRGGAYKHKQIQRSADENLQHNAERIAEEAGSLAVGSAAEIVVLSGDVQARKAVFAQLGSGLQDRVVEVEAGGRAAGAQRSPLGEELTGLLRERAVERVRAVVDSYEQQRALGERATEGLIPTMYALQRGQVDTLLWSEAASGGWDRLWIGPQPEQLGASAEQAAELGVPEPTPERADAALIRAVAATSAGLVFVPREMATLAEGIGALLRFDDPNLPG